MKVSIRSSQDLGQLIASARRRKGWSQRALADKFGVTQAWISKIERGQQKAWIGQVLRLAAFAGVDLTGEIVTDTKDQQTPETEYPDLDELLK